MNPSDRSAGRPGQCRLIALLFTYVLAPLWLASCVADSGAVEPVFGWLRITTITDGPEPDADGYSLSLNRAGEQPIGANATITLPNILPAVHFVQLAGVASNCVVSEGDSRFVPVTVDDTAEVSFALTCGGDPQAEPPTAGFSITAAGGGQSAIEGGQLDVTVAAGGFLDFTFDASRSTPGEGSTITAYEWQSNGTTISTEPTFTFALDEGTFVIRLKVTNSAALSHTAIATINITE